MDYYRDRITGILRILDSCRRTNKRRIENVKKRDLDYGERADCFDDKWKWSDFGLSETWGGTETHAAFKAVITIPEIYAGKKITVSLNTGATDIWNTDNPQFLVYINGKITCGHDMNHNEVILCSEAVPGERYEYGLYAYSNGAGKNDFLRLETAVLEEDVEELYYDLKVPFEIASLMKETDRLRTEYFEVLNDAVSILDLRDRSSLAFHDSVKACHEFLAVNVYSEKTRKIEKDPVSNVTVSAVGHTHIDVAWKWPLRQTKEKALRSFTTVLYEMDRYPEFKFMSSQPQLYEYVREESPEVYERIKERVLEGRWETEGAMWLEADCNLASGESLIRHIMFGKLFFKEEFGIQDNRVLWLPDVFGYSAALPQIIRKTRTEYFMTTKIGWNDTNRIPNDTFMWKGIDGTEVLTYFITTHDYVTDPELKPISSETTYNGRMNANQTMGTWQRYQNKNINDNVLTCFGFGDGGGGATVQMLEEERRLSVGLPGCPKVQPSHALEFFDGLKERLKDKNVPVWNGELYLEYHRGTYTSMARNKKFNRVCEIRNEDAETFSTYALLMGITDEYPARELSKCWKMVLLNQFHDILPGSSIEDVYKDSLAQYLETYSSQENLIRSALSRIVRYNEIPGVDGTQTIFLRDHIYVFNNTSFKRTEVIESEGWLNIYEFGRGTGLTVQHTNRGKTVWCANELPPKGYRVYRFEHTKDDAGFEELDFLNSESGNCRLHTPHYHVTFNSAFELVSVFDKENKREIIPEGKKGNELIAFEDIPKDYDAWNIDPYYVEKSWPVTEVTGAKLIENGPVRICFEVERTFNRSKIRQDICFYNDLRRIDFKTYIDWDESQILLKTFFPVEVVANKATYEIQYGNVERPTHDNTSWDKARFEVCAHKWADISENGYGVALMNDCKYGYSANDTTLSLTLLKSGIFPNPNADKEHHEFTYSILPHTGDFRKGNVVREAYFLNYPIYQMVGERPREYDRSFFYGLPDNVILEVVKLPHAGEASVVKVDNLETGETRSNVSVIMRFYECNGERSGVSMKSSFNIMSAFECDMLEYTIRRLEIDREGIRFSMKPYEIKTLKLIIKC